MNQIQCSAEDIAKASRIALQAVVNKGEDWLVTVLASIGQNVMDMVNEDVPVMHGAFTIEGVKINFDFYKHESDLVKMTQVMAMQAMNKADMGKPQ